MKNFNSLYEFLDRAVKSRKYPPNTVLGLKTALKLFELELHEEEKSSIKKFKENLEQIYQNVCTKNGKKFSSDSLYTYKLRVTRVLNDYEKYGEDATKMAGWSPKLIIRQKKAKDVIRNIPIGYSKVNVAENRIHLYIPSELKDRLIDDENVSEDWVLARTALKIFADKYIPKEKSE